MNRAFQIINFLGVVALAVLCAAQWRVNSDLNRQISDLERQRIDLTTQLALRDKRIREDTADLDDFRTRLTMAEGQLRDLQIKLNTAKFQNQQLTAERTQLIAQRDQLTTALDSWKAAVAARDQAIKQAGDDIKKVVDQRNEAVQKFNDLADKYNAVVKEINNERAKATATASQPAGIK